MRATLNDGRQVMLSMTHVVGDSIVGNAGPESVRFATAITDVRAIDEESLPSNASPLATAGMAVLIAGGLLVLLMLYVLNDAAGG